MCLMCTVSVSKQLFDNHLRYLSTLRGVYPGSGTSSILRKL